MDARREPAGAVTRVLIVDDHPVVRQGLRSFLAEERGIQVVGEVGDGRVALRCVAETAPHVVIMDVGLPELNGIDATRRIVADEPGTRVVGFTMRARRETLLEMLRAGAVGLVLKTARAVEVLEAVRAAARGGRYLGSGVADVLGAEGVPGGAGQDGGVFSALSPREREVAQLVAEGCSVGEIAATLRISARTVLAHRKNAMDKLGCDSEAALTRIALRCGLAEDGA